MSVVIKRSNRDHHFPYECLYGCCTPVQGKNVKKIRRGIKRAQRQDIRRQINEELTDEDDHGPR